MSGMADEMARRIEADGGAGLPPDARETGAAPGTGGESQAQQPPPPAGESNTDTGGRQPESIPYARFKEVNDRLKGYEGFDTLIEYGYDPDSLGRLAAFEAQYLTDPIGTWKALADNLDLPQELADALEQHLSGAAPTTPQAGRAEGKPPANAGDVPQQDPEMKEALEWVKSRRERERDDAEQKLLDDTLSHWDKLDKQEGIETPEHIKLAHLSAMGNSGVVFRTVDELVEAARKPVVEYRGSILGGAVRTGRQGSPLAVPGSASAATEPIDFGTDIRAATKAAEAAIARGELPT
jgi:hypothetical protein